MNFPTPQDMGQAPAWDNYLVAQAVQASLGLVSPNTVGIYLTISDTGVGFTFQLSQLSEDDDTDIADIVDNFNMLIGFSVPVSSATHVVEAREPSPSNARVRWIFSRRQT